MNENFVYNLILTLQQAPAQPVQNVRARSTSQTYYNQPPVNPFEPVQQPSWNTTPLKPALNNAPAQFANIPQAQSFPTDTFNPMNSYAQAAPPPPPPTIAQVPSTIGQQNISRSKYVVDPSVKPSFGTQPVYPQQGVQTFGGGYQAPMNPVTSYSTMFTESDYSTQTSGNQVYEPVVNQTQAKRSNYSTDNYNYQPQAAGWNDPPAPASSRNKVTMI